VKINGKQLEATPGGGSHFAISRAWRKGDRVELVVPMRLMSEPMPDDPAMQAFLFGPIVLSGDFGTQGLTEQLVGHQQGPETSKAPMDVPELRAQGKGVEDWIKPDGSAPRVPDTGSNPAMKLRSVNKLWGRFATYWNVS
jgi:DUF1680 family protein